MPSATRLSRISVPLRADARIVTDAGSGAGATSVAPQSALMVRAPTRTIAEIVALPASISRADRTIPRVRLDEARITNPLLHEALRPRPPFRPRPLPRPGCPAGGEHEQTNSSNYTLPINRAGLTGQPNWRRCSKCQGLVFGGHAGGVCIKGGAHELSQSSDYVLVHDLAPAGHQTEWRWCRKCDSLAFSGATGLCPAGGPHDHQGSSNYALAINLPEAEGQPNWRWCAKCQSLGFAGGVIGATREELALPVAASDPVTDATIFEAPEGPVRYHLGRYRLARRVVSGSEQYRIRMGADEHGVWSLEVQLDRVRPDGLPADTLELEHELLLQLVYRLTTSDGSSITKTLDFTAIGESEDAQLVIARLRFASPAERDQVLAAITTPGAGCGLVATRSVRVAAPIAGAAGRYRPVTRGLMQRVDPDPLFLNAALHPYLYDGAMPTGGAPGLELKQLRHETRFHSYWIDATDPAHVYFLPDEFRLARREKPGPFTPLMSVRLTPGATADAEPLIAFEFVATPWVDGARLEAATAELIRGLPTTGQPGDGAPARLRLEPLPAEKVSFWLTLPGAPGGGLVERPGAQMDVRTAVIVSETLPMLDFQAVYDALLGGAVALMTGEVRVELRPGVVERIPFNGGFARMNGELISAVVTPGATPGHFGITLTNAIESPLDLDRITATLLVGETEMAADAAFEVPLPQTLAPGASVALQVTPKTPLPSPPTSPTPEAAAVTPLLDFGRIRVTPDGAAIWAGILDADTAIEARRVIRVKVFPGMFDAPSGAAADRALAIIVQFDGGPSVELTPEEPEAQVRLATPFTDLVLRRADAGGYRYKCQVIRRGSRPADLEWRADRTDLLVPLLPEA